MWHSFAAGNRLCADDGPGQIPPSSSIVVGQGPHVGQHPVQFRSEILRHRPCSLPAERCLRALRARYATFKSRISVGRQQFLTLWHEGETPSRPWVRDRRAGPGTDMHTVTYFLRLRRQRRVGLEQGSQSFRSARIA